MIARIYNFEPARIEQANAQALFAIERLHDLDAWQMWEFLQHGLKMIGQLLCRGDNAKCIEPM